VGVRLYIYQILTAEVLKNIFTIALHRRPKIVFSPLLPKDVQSSFKTLVQRHNGIVVLRADQATHEIIPDEAKEDEEEDEYCRTISEQVACIYVYISRVYSHANTHIHGV